MAYPNMLRNFGLFVDGEGKIGTALEFEPPKLSIQTEEHRGGGMDAPIELDMGMEKLEAKFKLAEFDKQVMNAFGLIHNADVGLTARGSLRRQGQTQEDRYVMTMFGGFKELEHGTWKAGDKTEFDVTMTLTYFKCDFNGDTLHEIDIPNMKRVINGIDQLAVMRANIGYDTLV